MATHTTTVITVANATTAGSAIAVGFSCDDDGNPGTTATCADSKGNTYAVGQSVQVSGTGSGTGVRTVLFVALNSTALTTSDTITITHGAVVASAALSWEFKAVATSSALDVSSTNVSSGTSHTSNATGTLASAEAVFIGVFGVEGVTGDISSNDISGAGTVLVTGGAEGTSGAGAASNVSVRLIAEVPASTTGQSIDSTTGSSRDSASVIGAYKAVTGGTSLGDPKLMLNGTEYSKTLTTSNALYTQLVTSASYPSNSAGIGMRSSGTTADTFFYECGALIAYTPAVAVVPLPLRRRRLATMRI